jgi:hypothetical protein
MKKKLSLVVLLSLTLGAMLSGCNKPADAPAAAPATTNAPANP